MDAMKQKQNINDASETRHQSVVDCFHQTMNDQDPNKVSICPGCLLQFVFYSPDPSTFKLSRPVAQ